MSLLLAKYHPALAWRLTLIRPPPAGPAIGAKGFTPRAAQRGSSGRATIRRGLAVVWPEKDRQMTRARALKHAIRTRAAKTGERYTTARRHVLNSLQLVPQAETPAVAAPPAAKRAGLPSEQKFIAKTGHGFDHWFAVLDCFDAVKKGHTAAARHLYETHGVDGWYAQGITVAYERARGVRAVNQRCDGAYEVSVSKTMTGDAKAVINALTAPKQRAKLKVSEPGLVPALGAALKAPKSKGFVVRADGLGRYRYKWGDTIVQFYMVPKAGKVSVVVTNSKLADNAMVEERRGVWREMLSSLATLLHKN